MIEVVVEKGIRISDDNGEAFYTLREATDLRNQLNALEILKG